jgi:prepilin-type N-terminal cleavage/methylation domain-containing protein
MNQLKRHPHPQSTQAGFTVIESLLALIVVSILMVALSPVIVLSVATRVQARRVELASRAAKTYVDGVRSGLIEAPPISYDKFEDIDPPAPGALLCNQQYTDYCTAPVQTVGSVPVEKDVCKDEECQELIAPKPNVQVTTLYCIDQDGGGCTTDSTSDMIVQAVGYHPQPNPNPPTTTQDIYDAFVDQGYELGIRVYRASAFEEDELKKSQGEDSQQAGAAAGVFESQLPLLEMTTAITPNNPNFDDLKELYK